MALAYLMIGEVLRPQGVRGEMKVRPYAADPDMFLEWATLLPAAGKLPSRKAHCSRVHDGFAYLTLEGVTDRDGAEALRGTQLWIDRAHACQLPEDACYVCELMGCRAVDETGTEIGTLTDVLQYSSGGNWCRLRNTPGQHDGSCAQARLSRGGRGEQSNPRQRPCPGRGGCL